MIPTLSELDLKLFGTCLGPKLNRLSEVSLSLVNVRSVNFPSAYSYSI